MGRHPKAIQVEKMKKGGWSEEEDIKLKNILENGGANGLNWDTISEKAGLNRGGKSCRLRWKNYLSPHITRGNFSQEEEQIIIHQQSCLGNKWSRIAAKLPGRTDNDIKNLWNTKLRKKLEKEAIVANWPQPQTPITNHHYNFLGNNNLISAFHCIVNMEIPEAAKNLLLQDLIIRLNQEYSWLQLQAINHFPPASYDTLPFASENSFDAGICNNNCNLPALIDDEFCVNGIGNEINSFMDEASSSLLYDGAFDDHFWADLSN